MKKAFSILLAAALMFGIFAFDIPVSQAASASDTNLSVSIIPSPASMLEGGEVTFNVKAQNKLTDKQITNIEIDYGGSNRVSFAAIEAGATKTASFPLTIATDKLGTALDFNVSYNVDGAPFGFNVSAQVDKKVPVAKLTAKCNANRTAAPKDGKINFTFELENAGEAELTNMELSLPPINSGKKITAGFTSMKPGVQKTVVYEYTLKENIDVTPTIKYTANGEQKTVTLAVKNLVIANPDLTLDLSADKLNPAVGEEVNFTLVIKNTGNAKLKNIDVFDHLQQEIKSDLTLLPEKETTVTGKYTFSQTTDVVFSITAEDNDGAKYNDDSKKVTISIPVDKTKVKLELKAEASVYELTAAGPVTFKVTVINSGSYPLSEVTITEDKIGEIGKLDSLEAGEKYFEKEATVSETGKYTFKVTAKDADGNVYNAEALPLEVKLNAAAASSNPLESATDVPSEQTGSQKGDTLGTIIIIMVVIALLIIAVVVALVIMVKKEKKNQSKSSKPGVAKTVKYRNKNNF